MINYTILKDGVFHGKNNMTFNDLKSEVSKAMSSKPVEWRDGQFVFNYIDRVYGVARYVQFVDKTDCFYNDDKIDAFLVRCVERINGISENG